jgi:hypothetical protein
VQGFAVSCAGAGDHCSVHGVVCALPCELLGCGEVCRVAREVWLLLARSPSCCPQACHSRPRSQPKQSFAQLGTSRDRGEHQGASPSRATPGASGAPRASSADEGVGSGARRPAGEAQAGRAGAIAAFGPDQASTRSASRRRRFGCGAWARGTRAAPHRPWGSQRSRSQVGPRRLDRCLGGLTEAKRLTGVLCLARSAPEPRVAARASAGQPPAALSHGRPPV